MEALDIRASGSVPEEPATVPSNTDDLAAFQMLLEGWNRGLRAPMGEAALSAHHPKTGVGLSESCTDRPASKQVLEVMSMKSREIAAEIASLRVRLGALESALVVAQRGERETAIVVLQELLEHYGLQWGDVVASRELPSDRSTTIDASMPLGRNLSPLIKDAACGSTGKRWSGRGRRPNWLKQMLAEGRQLSEFADHPRICATRVLDSDS